MTTTDHSAFFIDGAWTPSRSNDSFSVVSPSTEERLGSVPAATTADIDAAVAAARRAFDETDWATRPAAERAELLWRLAEAISARRDELAALYTAESGSTFFLSLAYQTVAPTLSLKYYAQMAREHRFEEVRVSDLSPLTDGAMFPYMGKSLVVQEPVGVVVCVAAYNFALACAGQKAGPALAAGCTVVLKVPEPNPLASFVLGELMEEVGFPPGVLNIVAAGPEASEHLVRHPDVDLVSFTGSTTVGRRVGEICGSLVRPVVLELGGKSAAVLLDDADLDVAIPTIVQNSVGSNAGQSCLCLSRVLAPRSRYEQVADALAEAFAGLQVGDPMDQATMVGPLITEKHRESVLGHVERAVQDGATVRTGGGRPAHLSRGWYVEPTLLIDVDNRMAIAQEEVFGPVVALVAYDDEDDAIRLANDSRYGLTGCVFTSTLEHGFEVARRVRTGTFSVNTYATDLNCPFGGVKESGVGREHGPAGFHEMLRAKTISIDPAAELPTDIVERAARA